MSLDNLLDRGFGVCLLAESHLGCSGVDNVVEQLEKYRRQQDNGVWLKPSPVADAGNPIRVAEALSSCARGPLLLGRRPTVPNCLYSANDTVAPSLPHHRIRGLGPRALSLCLSNNSNDTATLASPAHPSLIPAKMASLMQRRMVSSQSHSRWPTTTDRAVL